jgi:6,7-dimethyl-8-ribityllumazine synthase
MTKPTNIAFIKAQWHAQIVDQSLTGFEQEIGDAQVAVFDVPGAFEMPLLAKKLAQTGKYDAIVAAAFVVNGGIYHHEFVSAAVVDGLMQGQMETGVPMFSVSLTPHNFQETPELIDFFTEHFVKKGAEAAQAVKQTLAVHAAL